MTERLCLCERGREKAFIIAILVSIDINSVNCLEQDSNSGPNQLSLLEFETWQIRPLSHHGRISHLFFQETNSVFSKISNLTK